MVIKLYISGISGNKEVKKKQQRVQMILDSKQINYEAIDITEPGKEKDKEFMQQNGKVRESLGKHPLPPQIFNDDDFCGDYEDFDMANEVDELEKFLHIETSSKDSESEAKPEEIKSFNEKLKNKKQGSNSEFNPYDYHTFQINVNGLKEPITNSHESAAESEQTEEVKKSEVNGESEASPLETSENANKNVEMSREEVFVSEKEESAETNERTRKEGEEDAENEQKQEDETEAKEKEEEKEDVENPEEETVENPNKENSPPAEEEEIDKDKDEEEEIDKDKEEEEEVNKGKDEEEEVDKDKDEEEEEKESEKEEKESDEESPESEKSQE